MTALTVHQSDIIDDWLEVRRQGYTTFAAAAERLHLKPKTLEHIVSRARRAGDPRIPKSLRNAQPPRYDAIDGPQQLESSIRVSPAQRRKATRHVASQARNAGDLADLLWKLGLTAQDGKA